MAHTVETSGPDLFRFTRKYDDSHGWIKAKLMEDLSHLSPHSIAGGQDLQHPVG